MTRGIACAAVVCGALVAAGCTGKTTAGNSPTAAQQTAPAVPNAPVPAPGASGPIPLDNAQRAQIEKIRASVSAAERARLRYALADDSGKRVLIVYVSATAPPGGKKGTAVYNVYKPLNRDDGATYDPEQNAVIAPIPVPSMGGNSVAAP